MLLRELQAVQMNKALINILNELPEFKGRELFNEFFHNNNQYKSWIITEVKNFFEGRS